MAIVRRYGIECDDCHVVVGWSALPGAACEERSAAGWYCVGGRHVCAGCVAEAVVRP